MKHIVFLTGGIAITIAEYQRDHGLYVTSAIDEPTLQSLGMA